jgi:murein DD-endopeptidase MepM/ murein hydrolase activator NlpD
MRPAPGVRILQAWFDRLPLGLQEGVAGERKALAAIGRREPLGTRELLVRYQDPTGTLRRYRYAVEVTPGDYPVSRLRVPPKLASPPAILADRLMHEQAAHLFGAEDPAPPPTHWRSPVPGAVTSRFGSLRYFNGVRRGLHLGVDLRAPAGQAVYAPAPGRVVGIRREYLGGLTLRVDHGDGWVSHFMHLDEAHVQPEQRVVPGVPLARVGSTGRVTGPHLHWAVTWRGRYLDPMRMLGAGAMARSSHEEDEGATE